MPGRQKLPDTLKRSSAKAQRTWAKTHDGAVREYGEGARAHRTAFAALKHSFEKRGDRWIAKAGRGPSDPRARSPAHRPGTARARRSAASTTMAAPRKNSMTAQRSSTCLAAPA